MQKYSSCSSFVTATSRIVVAAHEKVLGSSRVSYTVSPAGSKLYGSCSASQRSPLAPRNSRCSSTPRDIILRKQVAQAEKFHGRDNPTSEHLVTKKPLQLDSSWDKENL